MALPILLLAAGVQAATAEQDTGCVSVSVRFPKGAACDGGSFATQSVQLLAPAALAGARATRTGAHWSTSSVVKVRSPFPSATPLGNPAHPRGVP